MPQTSPLGGIINVFPPFSGGVLPCPPSRFASEPPDFSAMSGFLEVFLAYGSFPPLVALFPSSFLSNFALGEHFFKLFSLVLVELSLFVAPQVFFCLLPSLILGG